MKTILYNIAIVIAGLYFTSCEKVIEYDLNESSPRYAIEGSISNLEGQCSVRISKSVNFTESNDFPKIKGALVTISDSYGKTDTLNENESGLYTLPKLIGLPGKTYSLKVTIDGETFTANSTMPVPVNFDNIEFSVINSFQGTQNVPIPIYLDPVNETNYYRFIERVNKEKSSAIFVRDDRQSNGRMVKQPLFDFSGESATVGDTIEIEMMCIDDSVYEYFYSLSQISSSGGPNSTGTPANPISNISGGVLGYFSAHYTQIKTAIVP